MGMSANDPWHHDAARRIKNLNIAALPLQIRGLANLRNLTVLNCDRLAFEDPMLIIHRH
jgi:hypothetical protein